MAIATIAAAAAAKKALENVVDDAYELGKAQFGRKIKRWKAKNKIDGVYKKIKNVRRVKTIWQVEKEVDLAKFYYPAKVIIRKKRKTIDDLSDFGYDGNIIVKGTIGQGKSIFFRFLTSQEMFKGRAIPLFIQLRRIKSNQTLRAHLLRELKALSLEMDEETLLFLAKEGKIILFLDAFDELKEAQRSDIISEVEDLAKSYDNLQILVSTRPNSGIEASPFFRVFELCALEGKEYEQVIAKMAHDETTAINIIKGVGRGKDRIAQLLTTPLMVALLMLRYRVDQSIPENAKAFYGDLFNLLLLRHDKTKAGYRRARKSTVGDAALLEIFNGICYLTRKADVGVLTLNELHSYAKRATMIARQDCPPDNIVSDIIDITCLIVEEGGECRFIHKSVQEYHAACFIKDQPEASAVKFYEAMASKWYSWEQELDFLSIIDKYRFLKFFAIPNMCDLLKYKDQTLDEWIAASGELLGKLGEVTIELSLGESDAHVVSLRWRGPSSWCLRSHHHNSLNRMFTLDFKTVAKDIVLFPKAKRAPEKLVSLVTLAKRRLMAIQIKAIVDLTLQDVQKELESAQDYIKHIEDTQSIFDF